MKMLRNMIFFGDIWLYAIKTFNFFYLFIFLHSQTYKRIQTHIHIHTHLFLLSFTHTPTIINLQITKIQINSNNTLKFAKKSQIHLLGILEQCWEVPELQEQ